MKRISINFRLTGAVRCKKTAWLPFEGAEFAAHRGVSVVDFDLWRVSHVRTTMAIPGTTFLARKNALEIAEKLSLSCPAASQVEFDDTVPARGRHGATTGPMAALARQIKSSIPDQLAAKARGDRFGSGLSYTHEDA